MVEARDFSVDDAATCDFTPDDTERHDATVSDDAGTGGSGTVGTERARMRDAGVCSGGC